MGYEALVTTTISSQIVFLSLPIHNKPKSNLSSISGSVSICLQWSLQLKREQLQGAITTMPLTVLIKELLLNE